MIWGPSIPRQSSQGSPATAHDVSPFQSLGGQLSNYSSSPINNGAVIVRKKEIFNVKKTYHAPTRDLHIFLQVVPFRIDTRTCSLLFWRWIEAASSPIKSKQIVAKACPEQQSVVCIFLGIYEDSRLHFCTYIFGWCYFIKQQWKKEKQIVFFEPLGTAKMNSGAAGFQHVLWLDATGNCGCGSAAVQAVSLMSVDTPAC